MRLHFRLLNVFTRGRQTFTGNPLCVFGDGRGLSEAQMQSLALQFNLSETTFVLPSEVADARVRIFTPGYEMPFAGHPTLGTAHVVRSLRGAGDALSLELNVGCVAVRATGDVWELTARAPRSRAPRVSRAEIAAALGLAGSDVAEAPLWVDTGCEQLIVPLASAEAVRRARIGYDALVRLTADGPRPQAYLFGAEGTEALVARFFFSKAGSVLEDPATGSAAANLGGWYLARGAPLPLQRAISQGAQAGRPSLLRLRIDVEGTVRVGGEVLEIGSGQLDL